ncbi:MAG: nucleoside triphosphate pyrophosphatase [Hyphomicrobiaceae bacterium]
MPLVEPGIASEAGHLILASASQARRDLLKNAGIAFTVQPADVDEVAIRQALVAAAQGEGVEAGDVAEVLARAKAEAVSVGHPQAMVIGADQTLSLDDAILSKPLSRAEARQQLTALKGRTHQLHSGVALALAGEIVWSYVETASLTVRAFSDAFLDDYLNRAGDSVMQSVGAYQVERIGIQLFEAIDGDHFTILGLPLLALMDELRARGFLLA